MYPSLYWSLVIVREPVRVIVVSPTDCAATAKSTWCASVPSLPLVKTPAVIASPASAYLNTLSWIIIFVPSLCFCDVEVCFSHPGLPEIVCGNDIKLPPVFPRVSYIPRHQPMFVYL